MALMHLEVFEALRSVMPEEKAIQGSVALYEAISKVRHGKPTYSVEPKFGWVSRRSPMTLLQEECTDLASEIASIRDSMRVLVWMSALSALLVTVLFIKVFSGDARLIGSQGSVSTTMPSPTAEQRSPREMAPTPEGSRIYVWNPAEGTYHFQDHAILNKIDRWDKIPHAQGDQSSARPPTVMVASTMTLSGNMNARIKPLQPRSSRRKGIIRRERGAPSFVAIGIDGVARSVR